jgi:hypothetical protein
MRSYLEQIPLSSIDPSGVDEFRERVRAIPPDSTPNHITNLLAEIKYSQVVIIIDEFDSVTDRSLHSKFSSLLKLVSDARLPVRSVLVGDTSTFSVIVEGHPSLARQITRVSTSPLEDSAIFELLGACAERCDLRVAETSLRLLADVVCGSPYHARLFGMHAALHAMTENRSEIRDPCALEGIRAAFAEWSLLNAADGAAFRAICEGAYGNPVPFIDFARRMACESDEGLIALANGSPEAPTVPHVPDLSAFGEAIALDDGCRFRDAAAPQFLVALHRTIGEEGARHA